jgi:hypothetical protein
MNTTETLKELLKLAHESLDSKDAKIAELESVIESLNYNLQSYEQE